MHVVARCHAGIHGEGTLDLHVSKRAKNKKKQNNSTSFYGSSCANNGKGALNTPNLEYVAEATPGVALGDQSREASEHIPRLGTNHARRASIYLGWGPITRGELAYTSVGDQSREASEHIP
eukprot:4570043-Pyramimonas_sp.AAC.1